MTCGLLHLNDVNVQLLNADGEQLSVPAQLVFENNQLLSGREALARVRIKPLHAYNQHWQQLNQIPIKLPDQRYRHHADLAYRQLEQWLTTADKSQPLIVAPSYRYSEQQYALLAGMLQALGANTAGFIHSALLHSYGLMQAEGVSQLPLIHVDICLHQAHITQLGTRENQLVIVQEWDIPSCGLATIIEGWMQSIAQTCIRQTRYNPLHSAESEQRLYNQWRAAFTELHHSESVELDIDGNAVELQRAQFHSLSAALNKQLAGVEGQILLSPVAQLIPGLPGSDLSDKHLCGALADLTDHFLGPVQLHRTLPLGQSRRASVESGKQPATHLLIGHTAYPLESPLHLRRRNGKFYVTSQATAEISFTRIDDYWQCQTELECSRDGETITSATPLLLGQILLCANHQLQLIQVRPDGT